MDEGVTPGTCDLTFRAQGLQPGDEHLAYFLLGKQFADFGGDFDEGYFRGASLFQFRDELVAIVGLDGLGIDLHSGPEAGIDQAHNVDLLLHVGV